MYFPQILQQKLIRCGKKCVRSLHCLMKGRRFHVLNAKKLHYCMTIRTSVKF